MDNANMIAAQLRAKAEQQKAQAKKAELGKRVGVALATSQAITAAAPKPKPGPKPIRDKAFYENYGRQRFESLQASAWITNYEPDCGCDE